MYNVQIDGLDGWDAIYLSVQRWMLMTYLTYDLMRISYNVPPQAVLRPLVAYPLRVLEAGHTISAYACARSDRQISIHASLGHPW